MKCFVPYLIAFLLWPALTSFAQQNGKVWTLEECIDKATSNNLTIMRSSKAAEKSQNAVSQAWAGFAPNVSASANHVYSYGRTVDPFTNVNLDRDQRTNNFSLNANVPLFEGLQNQYTLKRSKTVLDADLKDVEQSRNDVILQVTSAYLNILQSMEQLSTARIQLRSSQTQLDRNEKLLEAGSIPQSTFLEFKSQLATDELNVIQNENSLEIAKLNLQQIMQIPYDPSFQVFPYDIDENDLSLPPRQSADIYQEALITQPNIQSGELRIEGAKYNAKVASSARYPSLYLFGNMRTNYASSVDSLFSFGEQMDNNFGQSFGFQLDIPIFQQFRNRTTVQNAKIDTELAEISLEETKNTLRQDVEQAYLDAVAASKSYEAFENQVASLEETYRSVERRYRLAAASVFEFDIARNNLNQAQSDLIRAKYELVFRLKILDFYQGNPITF